MQIGNPLLFKKLMLQLSVEVSGSNLNAIAADWFLYTQDVSGIISSFGEACGVSGKLRRRM